MYLNIDINSVVTPFLNRVVENENVTKESLYPFVDVYAKSHVTDLLFCIFTQYSVTDTKFWSSYSDKFLQKTENGLPVDYTEENYAMYTLNKTYDIDPYAVWIERSKKVGIKPWISVRMNDCHGPFDDTYFLRSDFFYEAKSKGYLLGDQYGYYSSTFNYRFPEVREKMLDYIEEQALRYDVFGVELDFMREIFCFDYINDNMDECIAIMNGFMRSVKECIKKAEEKHGHEIKIAVRLTRDINESRIFGFDAKAWDKEGLVDVYIPTPRWRNSDSDMPIKEWKKEIVNAKVAAGIESLVSIDDGVKIATPEIARGLAAKYLSNGADGIYLYNYFVDPGSDSYETKRNKIVYNTCGNLDEIKKHPIRYAVMNQEADICPKGYEPYSPMPAELTEDEYILDLSIMDIPKGKDVSIIIGFSEGSPENTKIKVNDIILENFEKVKLDELDERMPHQPIDYASEGDLCYRSKINEYPSNGVFKVSLRAVRERATVCWLEIDII